jgi:hypothetical protein
MNILPQSYQTHLKNQLQPAQYQQFSLWKFCSDLAQVIENIRNRFA